MKITDITPSNIRNFVEGNINFYTKSYPRYQLEQFLYRAYLCKPCLENGKCTHCGCKTPQMFFAPRKQDSQDKWPPFYFHEIDWEDYKRKHLKAMEFSDYLSQNILDNTDPTVDHDIHAIVQDAAALLDQHRELDAQNPDIPLENTEAYKREIDKETSVSSEYPNPSSSTTSTGSILLQGVQ